MLTYIMTILICAISMVALALALSTNDFSEAGAWCVVIISRIQIFMLDRK